LVTKSGGSGAVVKGGRMNRKSLVMSDVDDGGLSGRPRLWTHHRPLKTRWWGDLSDSWLLRIVIRLMLLSIWGYEDEIGLVVVVE